VDLVKNVDFLKNLTSVDVKKLSSVMTPRVFKKDEVLVRKGDEGDAFYIIVSSEGLVRQLLCEENPVGGYLTPSFPPFVARGKCPCERYFSWINRLRRPNA